MPACAGPCTYSQQTIGDTTDTVDSSASYTKQLNPSSASNASGVDIGADQRLQQSGNTVDQSGNRLGDSNAKGNTTSIGATDNKSDASNYASNVGGAAAVGDTSARSDHSGDTTAGARADSSNALTGGNNAAKQGQQQGQSADNANTVGQAQGIQDAGNASQGQSAEIDASDNSSLSVDASDRSNHETNIDATARWYPPVFHQTPSQLSSPAMVMDKGACGPVTDKTREQVRGVFHGYFGANSVDLGWDDDLVAVADPATGNPGYYYKVRERDGSERLFGTQVTSVYAVIGVAGGRSLSLFGSGSKSAGEIGTSGNSTMQRLIARHTIQVCDAGSIRYELPVVEQVRQ